MKHEFSIVEMSQAMITLLVPIHLQDGLIRYIADGVPNGSGLTRIMEDRPVAETVGGLDEITLAGLPAILTFLHTYAPSACHGSPERVAAWIAHNGLRGAA